MPSSKLDRVKNEEKKGIENSIKPIDLLRKNAENDFKVPDELEYEYKNVLKQAESKKKQNVVDFLNNKENKIGFYNHLKNSKVEIDGKKTDRNLLQPMTPLGLLDHLRNYALSKHNEDVAQWFQDQWNNLYNSSKKKPSNGWTREILPEIWEGDRLVKHIEDSNDGKDPDGRTKDKTGEGTTASDTTEGTQPPAKTKEKPRSLMKKLLKKIWDVMKRPVKFLARGVGLMAKGFAHEIENHPGQFFGIALPLGFVGGLVGLVPYFLWLASHEHRRKKEATTGTKSPKGSDQDPWRPSWRRSVYGLQPYNQNVFYPGQLYPYRH